MISKTLTAASTRLIILGVLKNGNSYGYLIIKKVKELSGGRMNYTDGMMYPVLHRLEKDGLISSYWELDKDSIRRRKYYQITPKGKEALIAEQEQWYHVHGVLDQILKLKHV